MRESDRYDIAFVLHDARSLIAEAYEAKLLAGCFDQLTASKLNLLQATGVLDDRSVSRNFRTLLDEIFIDRTDRELNIHDCLGIAGKTQRWLIADTERQFITAAYFLRSSAI